MNKLWVNCLRSGGDVVAALTRLNPDGVILTPLSKELAAWASAHGKEAWGRAIDDSWSLAGNLLAQYGEYGQHLTGLIGPNEGYVNELTAMQNRATFEGQFIQEAHFIGKKAGVGSFGTGTPTLEGVDPNDVAAILAGIRKLMLAFAPALEIADLYLPHGYQQPGFRMTDEESWPWHVGRVVYHVQVYREAKLRIPPILFGEIGQDRPPWREKGWGQFYEDLKAVWDRLAASPWVKGFAVYCLGNDGNPKWQAMDVMEEPDLMTKMEAGLSRRHYSSIITDASGAVDTQNGNGGMGMATLEEVKAEYIEEMYLYPALAKYAARYKLGVALGPETTTDDGYTYQKYQGGLVYAPTGEWTKTAHIDPPPLV